MRPIDALTGLPKSPEVARLVAAQVRQGELQSHSQASVFSREMRERENSVNEAPKVEGGEVDAENAGTGGGEAYDGEGRKRSLKGHEGQTGVPAQSHPSKGRILDIRGS